MIKEAISELAAGNLPSQHEAYEAMWDRTGGMVVICEDLPEEHNRVTLDPDLTDATLGIARTIAAYDGDPDVREVEALYLRSIDLAERHIYIENQFVIDD